MIKSIGKGILRYSKKALVWSGKKLWRNKKEIAYGVGGAVKGTGETLVNTASFFYCNDKNFSKLEEKIKKQSEKYKGIIDEKSHVLDMGIISGVVLADYVISDTDIPVEIEDAYRLAYPNLAKEMDFKEIIHTYNGDSLRGVVSSVKGKLFETKYVDYLNDGNLPRGYTAELAADVTQPGWDIAVKDADGAISEVLQCKASDSLSYVKQALKKYPDIDVVTTDEVYSQALMHSIDGTIINSGISEDSIAEAINQSIEGFDFGINVPAASLALIAFSAFNDQDKSVYQKSFDFGDRSAKAVIAYSAGASIPIWWVGLLTTMGVRYLSDKGKDKRINYSKVRDVIKNNKKVIKKFSRI